MSRLLIFILVLSLGLNAYLLLQYKAIEISDTTAGDLLRPSVLVPDLEGEPNNQDGRSTSADSLASRWNVVRDDLHYLFLEGEVTLAVEGALAERAVFPNQVNVLIDDWIALSGKRLEDDNSEQWTLVADFLDAVATERYQTLDYLLLRADWLFKSGDSRAAIDLYMEQLNTTTGRLNQKIQRRFDVIIESLMQQLFDNLQWNQGVAVAERLVWHRPDNGNYLMMLARMQFELGQYQEAKQHLLAASAIPDFKHQAEAWLQKISLADKRSTSIALVKAGKSQFIARGRVNGRESISLLIDTGATLSVIDSSKFAQVASASNARFIEEARFKTAGGPVLAPIYRLQSFALGDYEVRNIDFAVMDLGGAGDSDGLLGMNYLGQFKFELDQDNALLVLSPR